jgi:hypothetical protein
LGTLLLPGELVLPLALVSAAVLELVLWLIIFPPYFRFGLPLYSAEVPISTPLQRAPNAREMRESQVPSLLVPFEFRDVGSGSLGFRESLGPFFRVSYPPLMHGLVRFVPGENSIRVVGYANLFTCAIFGSFIVPALWLQGSGFSVAVLLFGIGCYMLQARRFAQIGRMARSLSGGTEGPAMKGA